MISSSSSSSTFGITTPASTISELTEPISKSDSISQLNQMVISDPEVEVESPVSNVRISPQLNRWSRARAMRSGIKLDRPTVSLSTSNSSETNTHVLNSPLASSVSSSGSTEEETTGKAIYMVSDGTGWTAEQSVKCALGQFQHCLLNRVCSLNTHLFSGIDDVERLIEIIKQAAKEGAMLIYTLADPSMAKSAKQACNIWNVPSTDILSPITEAISSHLGVTPSGIPRGAPGRNTYLGDDYFRRIEAIEFTIKQDDGALPENLHKAEIILTGVSRTGKTPLSTYLANKGYKIANVPIVKGIELPKTMLEVDQRKVFGLTINPNVLRTIRRERAKSLGFSDEIKNNYSEIDYVKQDLEYARSIFAMNPVWPVIEITGKAIEETAAVILRLYHESCSSSMPRISRRY